MEVPSPGYSIVVACHHRFPEMLIANLRLLARQDLTHMDRLIIVFDTVPDDRLAAIELRMLRDFPAFRIQFLYQTHYQARLLGLINWGWVDCWLSYCKGIDAATTRYVMLHDMDAMLLRQDIVEERFAAIRERDDQYVGQGWYVGNGIEERHQIVYIVELMFDAIFLKERFHPLDLFNQVTTLHGSRVHLDTLLYPQLVAGRRSVLPIAEDDMVHPSQVISQFSHLTNRRGYVPPAVNNLFFIPYFLQLAGGTYPLRLVRWLN
jgi:hypothetical protein